MAKQIFEPIEVSGNGTSVAGVCAGRGEAYFAPFARRLADEVHIPVLLVGGLRSREAMQRVLDETGIELLSLSRPLLFDPAFPAKLEAGELDASGKFKFEPVITVADGRVSSRSVRFKEQLGSWKGLRFTYGKNMAGCMRTVLEQDVYTALYGFGAGLPVTDEDGRYTRRPASKPS